MRCWMPIKRDKFYLNSDTILQPSLKKSKGVIRAACYRGQPLSKILIDSAEAKLLVLLCHFYEIAQAFFELVGPFPGALDKSDADALVWLGEPLEVLPCLPVCPDCPQDILRDLKRLLQDVAQAFPDLLGDLALFDQFSEAFLIGRGVRALKLTRREPLCHPVLIQRLEGAVNPAKAQGFLNSVVVFDARLTGPFFGVDQPDLFLSLVMLAQPLTPVLAMSYVESFGYFHFTFRMIYRSLWTIRGFRFDVANILREILVPQHLTDRLHFTDVIPVMVGNAPQSGPACLSHRLTVQQ